VRSLRLVWLCSLVEARAEPTTHFDQIATVGCGVETHAAGSAEVLDETHPTYRLTPVPPPERQGPDVGRDDRHLILIGGIEPAL
jgi:hypothetical protein